MIKIEELKKQLAISRHNLDEEVANQPMLFYEIAEQYEIAAAEADAAKEELATTDARLDTVGREVLAEKYDKVTEAMVRNYVQTEHNHDSAFRAYLNAKERAGKLAALRDAFKQRGYMLRDLASLQSASFFETTSLQNGQYQERRRIIAEARARKANE
jgi:hypothetical protein